MDSNHYREQARRLTDLAMIADAETAHKLRNTAQHYIALAEAADNARAILRSQQQQQIPPKNDRKK